MNVNKFLYFKGFDTNPFVDRRPKMMFKNLEESQEPWNIVHEEQPFEPKN